MWLIFRSLALAAVLTAPWTTSPSGEGTTPAGTPTAPSLLMTGTAPAAPDGCRAFRFYAGNGVWYAAVLWNDNSDDEDGFLVEWSGPHDHGTLTLPSDSTQATAPSGRNFRYRVRAFNAYGQSGWSHWAYVFGGGGPA